MQDANAREDTSADVPEDSPDQRPVWDADGIAEETEFLPYTPGDDLPDEVQEILEEAASTETPAVAVDAEPAPDAVGAPAASSVGDGGSPCDKPAGALDELRAIFLGHAATGQLDIAQVAASMEDRLESARQEIVSEMGAVERRLRDEIKGAITELLSEVEDRVLHRGGADDPSRGADELLNLVSMTHGNLRAELEKQHHETRHALEDVLSLVRELARTLVIMIGGNEDESAESDPDEAVVLEAESAASRAARRDGAGGAARTTGGDVESAAPRAAGVDVDAPLLKELPADRDAPRAPPTARGPATPDSTGGGARGSASAPAGQAPGEEPTRPSRAAKLFF